MLATRVARIRSPFLEVVGDALGAEARLLDGAIGEPHGEVVVRHAVEIERLHLEDDRLFLTQHPSSLMPGPSQPAVRVVPWGQRGWVDGARRRGRRRARTGVSALPH